MIPSKKTLEKLKAETYINAVRLFCDGCALFKIKSYASACALAILSLEELGKLEMVDHICDDICLNPEHDPQQFLNQLFSRQMFLSHKNKQFWAYNLDRKHIKDIAKGVLDQVKQDSFYVGYSNRRIHSPRKVSSFMAFSKLETCFNKIKEIGDLGFNGFYCESDKRSRSRASWYFRKSKRAFSD